MTPLTPNPPAAVYRHIGPSGEILYVGCSINPMARFGMHRSQSPWATQVSRIDIEWFEDQKTALDAEYRLIKKLRPPYNRQVNRKKTEWQRNPGHIILAAWIDQSGATVAQVGKSLGVSPSSVRKLLTPRSHPRHRRAVEVSVVTGGCVPRRAWSSYQPEDFCAPLTGEAAKAELDWCEAMLSEWGRAGIFPIFSTAAPARQGKPLKNKAGAT